MSGKSRDRSKVQQDVDDLEFLQDGISAELSKSLEQEANDALAERGLKVITEVHYQAKLQSLIELTFEPIPDISNSLFDLLPPNAKGYTNGSLRDEVRLVVNKAALEAKRDLASKEDRDLPVFDFSRPYNFKVNYSRKSISSVAISSWMEGATYTLSELECCVDFSREPLSSTGFLAQTPLFYVGNNGLLCNNWKVTVANYAVRKVISNHDFLPNEFHLNVSNPRGMCQLFTGQFDRSKLSKASVEIQILYYVWYIAANLVKAGAIMPQLFINYESRLQCRWIPAILSPEIKTLVTKVGLFLSGYEYLFLHRVNREEPLDPLFLGQLMLSGFIHSYVTWTFATHLKTNKHAEPEFQLLFSGISFDITDDRSKSMCLSVEGWLSPLSMKRQSITPVLRLYDLDDPDSYNESIFSTLREEIKEDSIETKQLQRIALDHLSPEADLIVEKSRDRIDGLKNFDLDDLDANKQQLAAQKVKPEPISKTLTQSFGNTVGVGMELGFSGIDKEVTNELYKRGLIDDSGLVSLSLVLNESCCSSVRYHCLRMATRLASVASILSEIISNPNNICVVSLDKLYETLQIALGALSLLGVKVVLPRSLKNLLRPTSTVRLDLEERPSGDDFDNNVSFVNLASMLKFDWQLAIGDRSLNANEFKILLANTGKIVRFHDQFVYADPAALLRIQNHLKKQQTMQTNRFALMNAVLTGKLEDKDVRLSPVLKELVDKLTSISEISLPKGLNAELRPYQKRGYEWLMHNYKVKIGSILADDMGLGKTIQVISLMLKLKEDRVINGENQALVVVPTTLIPNWINELKHFAPDLTTSVLHGSFSNAFTHTDIIVTSYGVVRSRLSDFKRRNYQLVVVDEAQAIKNRNTAVNKALQELRADYFIAMSGTPVENHLIEYYSILDFANRGLFGTVESFRSTFATPIEKYRDQGAIARFRSLTRPFLLRRLKTDKNIINDLPDKQTSNQFCLLTSNQTALYQSVVNSAMESLDQSESRQERSALVLKLVHELRAICNSPAQYDKSEDKFKASDSGKVQRLLALIDEVMAADGKVLVFTQSVIMGNYLVEILRQHTGRAPQFLHGGLNIDDRLNMVNNFQRDPNEKIMLLSLRAAGTGLNLTAANYVIHFDLWWNPAVENQATDRAYRIGQKRNVIVYRLICANTFEEKINEMLNNKKDLADLAVTAGEGWIGELSNRQLNELFSLSEGSTLDEDNFL